MLGYIFLGGLTSAIYNEVLQFFLIVAGLLPLVWIGLRNVGGWQGIKHTLPANMTHCWQGMAHANTNALGVEWFGLVMGLGFVLQLRLLVYQLPGDPARDGRRLGGLRAQGAADCRRAQDVSAIPGDSAGADRGLRHIAHGSGIATPDGNHAYVDAQGKPLPMDEAHPHGIIPVKTDPITGKDVVDSNGVLVYDYNKTIPVMLLTSSPPACSDWA